jgi:hypothetical protein
MANRTLRRPRTTTIGITELDGINDGASESIVGTDDSIPSAKRDSVAASDDAGDDTGTVDKPVGSGVVEIDPADLDKFIAGGGTGGDSESDSDKPRKRKPRSDAGTVRRKRGSKEAPQDITALLNMVHTWAPIMLGIPELAADAEELEKLSSAYNEFCKFHAVPAITEKRISEANLIIALFSVYGTRGIAYFKRMSQEKKEAKEKAQQVLRPNFTSVGHPVSTQERTM